MSNDEMSDDTLKTLSQSNMPAANPAARERALAAAMLAFDAEQKKAAGAPQGKSILARLRSIVPDLRGNWIMDTRMSFGLGTAAVALLLLPLGYQLMTSTAITQPPIVINESPVPTETEVKKDLLPRTTAETTTPTATTEADPVLRQETVGGDDGAVTSTQVATTPAAEREQSNVAPLTETKSLDVMAKPVQPATVRPGDAAAGLGEITGAPAPEPLAMAEPVADMEADLLAAPAPIAESRTRKLAIKQRAFSDAPATAAAGTVAVESFPVDADESGRAITDPSGDEFTEFTESPLKVVAQEPVSTFSIDVDTASYSYVRRSLTEGWVPEPDAIRIEEMINYFDYNYAGPESAENPFRANVQLYPTPWNPKTQLLQIGIKGYEPPVSEDKASNLTFLLDTSGSMDEPDKLPLLKRAFTLLVNQLGANDSVSIVVYAGSAGVVLEPTKATEKAKILAALENLSAGGSTAGAEGIELAYRLAEQNKVAVGINRVILATDGDFNVGIDDPNDLENFIKAKRDAGISLSVLGFGQGNLGDDTMQALAQNGNGNAAYIDSFKEAQKVLVEQIGGTLETIAKDVKIQIEFNPAQVAEYRLIGYETRALNREDFNNDKVDAGEIGAGHTVTALYEIVPVGSGAELVDPLHFQQPTADTPTSAVLPSDDIAFLKLRYKAPEGTESTLIETPVSKSLAVTDIAQASEDARWAAAVAAFGQKLKGSNYGEAITYAQIRQLAQGARGTDALGYRAEFMQLINMAESLNR